MRKLTLIVVGMLIVFSSAVGTARGQKAGATLYTVEKVPCPISIPNKADVEGKTYECGVITVPENYDKPDGRTIELAYVKLISTRPDGLSFGGARRFGVQRTRQL